MPLESSLAPAQARCSARIARAPGRGCRDRAYVRIRHRLFQPQQRVGKNLAQRHFQLALLHPGQSGEVDIENVRQLEQQGGRDIALVMFDQIQITRGNPEFLREALLRIALLHAQAADRLADGRF